MLLREKEKEIFSLTGSGGIENVKIDPELCLRINRNFIQYLYEDHIVFVSGSNLVIYNMYNHTQKYLIRKNNHLEITFLSVGYIQSKKKEKFSIIQNPKKPSSIIEKKSFDKEKEALICLGEYSQKENCFYITVIKSSNPNIQYSIKSNEPIWRINYASILNNSQYCVTISQRPSNSKKNLIYSRLSFAKFTIEEFVSQETIPEDLTYCCYNPKNTIELVVCGKGYLRLWNVFINKGSLKEHQQRFLRGKQEKEHTFIKAQFFDKKPFLLIVGTVENLFYIIDSFQVIHELNVCYPLENIYDLNVQNFTTEEESDDITELKKLLDSINKKELDASLKEISMLASSGRTLKKISKEESKKDIIEDIAENKLLSESDDKKSESDDVFKRLYKAKEKEDDNDKMIKSNKVRFFELINDNLLFVIYQDQGILLFYKIEWNKKIIEGQTEIDNRKWNIAENRIIRVAKNIETISNFSMFKIKNDIDIILLVDSYVKKGKDKSIETALFIMKGNDKPNQNMHQISFGHKLFNGFFEYNKLKLIDFNEKKANLFLVEENNILKCFDLSTNEYVIQQKFNDDILSISSCPSNNLLAVSFPNKVSILSKIKNKLHIFCDLEVKDSIVQWSSKGDILVLGGEDRNKNILRHREGNKGYCLYFIDAFSFNTINVIENLNKIIELKFLDNDKYIFCRMENSRILGWYMNTNGLTVNSQDICNESKIDINSLVFKLIFSLYTKEKEIECFDYDENLKMAALIQKGTHKMNIVSNPKNPKVINIEIPSILLTIKIIKELNVFIGGDKDGNINVYKWPPIGYDGDIPVSLRDSLMSSVNVHSDNITKLIPSKNNRFFITKSSNGSVVVSALKIMKKNEYRYYEYFDKKIYPQIEKTIEPRTVYEMKIEDIMRKEQNVEILEKAMIRMTQTMDAVLEEIQNIHTTELENMQNNLNQNIDDEEAKRKGIESDIESLKNNMDKDLENRTRELEKDKNLLEKKHQDKIKLYDDEIERLNNELDGIRKAIEDKFTYEEKNQEELRNGLRKEYEEKYRKIQSEIDGSLTELVNINAEYDEATDKITEDYEKLIKRLEEKKKITEINNSKILEEKDQSLSIAKQKEDEHKEKLEEKVKESDKLIEKNVEIKQSIINATQRTITFQEQLLETEKNLLKIDKKLEDLISKNKHLEQIRFVLEHRMTSLEKEKAPLEGQCSFLENQKNKLTEEFNKIILQINMHNQELENKQSQLRASLIQNYEIHDQKNYVESKLIQLKSDVEQFLLNYQEIDPKNLSENKATKVALNFKLFYDKYFSNTIEEELANYQYYSQKLQEQTDKDGIANNFDLIMRNKAEEKLICEKDKVEELKYMKERGFKRMQNENTILIAECNRLRKSLHEIYMHVVDIEQKFEHLTKINPKLTKSEIVAQIKDFIQKTHQKIKENYSKTKKITQKVINKSFMSYDEQGEKKVDVDKKFLPDKKVKKEESKINITNKSNVVTETQQKEKQNGYEGIIKLPNIKNSNNSSFYSQNKANMFEGIQNQNKSYSKGSLPKLDG